VQDALDTLQRLVRNLIELVVLNDRVRLWSSMLLVLLIWQFNRAEGLLIYILNQLIQSNAGLKRNVQFFI
jgi:hypothetical protein